MPAPSTQRYADLPDAEGHFGPYGGIYVAETLMAPLDELRQAYERYREDPAFLAELDADLQHYVGRPSGSWRQLIIPFLFALNPIKNKTV